MSMQHLNAVQYALIKQLRDDLIMFKDNVVITTDMDYSKDGSLSVKQNTLPIMILSGPTMERNALFTSNARPIKKHGEPIPGFTPEVLPDFTEYTAEDAVDLIYALTILDSHMGRWMDIQTQVYAYFMNGKNVTAEKNPGFPADGKNTYEIDLIGKFSAGRMVNLSNLKETTGSLIVRGVLVSDCKVFAEGKIAGAGQGWTVEDGKIVPDGTGAPFIEPTEGDPVIEIEQIGGTPGNERVILGESPGIKIIERVGDEP